MIKNLVLFHLIVFFYLEVHSQEASNSFNNFPELNSDIIQGTLENGLTYYIKPLEEPKQGLKMMFLVKTGSYDEKPHEMDFAHHIEHLAFRETKNFPDGLKGNAQLLAALNMKDNYLSGMTGDKMTRYWFDVPDKNIQAINKGLLWFKDIAIGLDLSQKNINRERGVLLQEYLASEATQEASDIESKMENELFPCLNDYSNFVAHNRSFPFGDLNEFYKKWYRPDRMSIILVGNIPNIDEITQKINEEFSIIRNDLKPFKMEDCDSLYLNSKQGFSSIPFINDSKGNVFRKPIKIQLYFKDPKAAENPGTIEAIERNLKVKVVTTILNRRFTERNQLYNNPGEYFGTHTSYAKDSHRGKPANAFKIVIQSEINYEKESLQKCINILNQFKTFGITGAELDTVKEELIKLYSPEIPSNPDEWMREITKYIVYDEALPTGKNTHLKEFFKNLSTGDFNGVIKDLISEMPQDIGVIVPDGYLTKISSEKRIRNLINTAFKKPVFPYRFPDVINQLLTEAEQDILTVGEIINAKEGVLGSKEYQLKNGIKVILKSMNTSESNIVFHGFSPFGVSCVPEEHYYSAMFSPSVVTNAGIGNFTKFELQRFYDSSNSLKMELTPYVNYDEVGIKAKVSMKEIEDLLQLSYLFFTKPRKDLLAFKDWQAEQLNLTAISLSPNNDLIDNLNKLTKDFTNIPYSSKRINAIKRVNFDKAYYFYNQLFGDPTKFTFILSGDFDENEILPLLQKYLGNITKRENLECNKALDGNNLKSGPVYSKIKPSELYKTQNSFYGLKFIQTKKENDNWKEELRVKALGLVANDLLFSLRSEEGLALYYFGAGGVYNRNLERYEISFKFNCTPEERTLITHHTKEFINDLKTGNISKELLQSAINQLLAFASPVNLNTKNNMANSIYMYYRFDENPLNPSEVKNFIRSITIMDISKTAQTYLRDVNKYELVMENLQLEKSCSN